MALRDKYTKGLKSRDYYCDICNEWADGSMWSFCRPVKEAFCPDGHYFHTSDVMSRVGTPETPRPLF